MVQSWSVQFSQAAVVVLGAGPPCQGVSGLNADRKGALRDERSCLFSHVKRIGNLLRLHFPWAQVHELMESVASMDNKDRDTMSADFGSQPWRCDAGTLTWCSRPRYYWVTWELQQQDGVNITAASGDTAGEVALHAHVELEEVCEEGWIKVDPSKPFPTFTTARPRSHPGRKPAGIHQCSGEELARWTQDEHRYPPYQYKNLHAMVSKRGALRLPSVREKEYMMGFPIDYTLPCLSKGERKDPHHTDCRSSLLGNSWSVPVVAWFLGQLFGALGLCPMYTPQDVMNLFRAGHQTFLQSRMLRPPLRPLRGAAMGGHALVHKLTSLVSVKGEDILLSTPSSQMVKYHRLRASVPSNLWKWSIVSGWAWHNRKEHINALELRAVLTSLKWRLVHKRQRSCRFLHLVDSLVALHILSRGRSSSRKLRSTLSRVNALLLVTSSQALWGYVNTSQNPADRPSRWGRRVKTKYRHA
eukprot:Skav219854  [mRNA]  locus=scaffold859:647168:648580:- [translate_table: standard]